MADEELQRYEDDELILARIGGELFRQDTMVKVRISSELAADAVRAWTRDENGPRTEDPLSQWKRHRAATLALIGLAIEGDAEVVDGEVVVTLGAWFIGSALDAAEDAGLLDG